MIIRAIHRCIAWIDLEISIRDGDFATVNDHARSLDRITTCTGNVWAPHVHVRNRRGVDFLAGFQME